MVGEIMSIIVSMGVVTFAGLQRKGRDERRKADIEQIRGALEFYRTNNNAYPTALPTPSPGLPFGFSFGDGTNTYLQTIPSDPRSPARKYYYSTSGSDYTLATQLESTSSCASTPPANSCGTGLACNYCLGAYGQK